MGAFHGVGSRIGGKAMISLRIDWVASGGKVRAEWTWTISSIVHRILDSTIQSKLGKNIPTGHHYLVRPCPNRNSCPTNIIQYRDLI
jgi:hypothetical protein